MLLHQKYWQSMSSVVLLDIMYHKYLISISIQASYYLAQSLSEFRFCSNTHSLNVSISLVVILSGSIWNWLLSSHLIKKLIVRSKQVILGSPFVCQLYWTVLMEWPNLFVPSQQNLFWLKLIKEFIVDFLCPSFRLMIFFFALS